MTPRIKTRHAAPIIVKLLGTEAERVRNRTSVWEATSGNRIVHIVHKHVQTVIGQWYFVWSPTASGQVRQDLGGRDFGAALDVAERMLGAQGGAK